MTKGNNTFEATSFEKALTELEEIVKVLEAGNINLEEALQKFEEGIKLSRYCNQKLNDAERKINLLLKDEGGAITIQPADAVEGSNER